MRAAHRKHGGLTASKRIRKYGFLFRNLKPDYYWVRLMTFVGSFFLALQASLSSNVPTRVFVAAILALCFSMIVLGLQPFDTTWRNIFYSVLGFVVPIVASFYLGTLNEWQYMAITIACVVGELLLYSIWVVLLRFGYLKARPIAESKSAISLTRTSGIGSISGAPIDESAQTND